MLWREIHFLHPWAFALLAAAPLVVWMAVRSLAYLGLGRRLASAALRVLALAAIAAALASPVVPEEHQRLCRAVAVDTSLSVPDEALERAVAFVREADEARPEGDTLVVMGFGQRAGFVDIAELDSLLRGDGDAPRTDLEQTDLVSTAVYARSVLPEGCSRRLVIVTDGWDTVREPASLEAGIAGLGMPVDIVKATGDQPGEVIVEDMHVPARVRTRRPFHVRASIFSSDEDQAVDIALVHTGPGGVENTVEEKSIVLAGGLETVEFTTQVRQEGEHLFRIEIAPSEIEDAFPENNFYEAATDAAGPPTILYADSDPSKGKHLEGGLEAAGFDVDVVGPGGLPTDPAALEDYTAVFVSDVPAHNLGGGKVSAIKGWVKQGGVFVFAGGKKSYQMGGYRGSSLEPFLPVSMEVPTDVEKTSAAVVLVIDTSGSMSGAPIQMAREAAKASVAVLQPDDLVEVIAFDSKPKRLFMMQKAKNQMMIQSFISKLRSGGGTDIVKALDLAYRDISPVQAKKKHIVLLTDGQSSMAGVDTILQNASSEGITISTIGLGNSVQRSFLEKIANATGGKASFTNNPKNLPRLFMREMRIVTPAAVVEGVMKVKVGKKAPFLSKVHGGFPYLRGYNLTTPRGGAASPVLVSDRGDPVLAMWKQGKGWSIAFTSDVKARWASPWVKWSGWPGFWNALIRSLAKAEKKTDEVHSIAFAREGRLVTATVDLVDRDTGGFIDDMEGTLLVHPFGDEATTEVPMEQVAPGRYQGSFLADSYGTFLARVTFTGDIAPPQPAAGSLKLPYPAEYRRIGADDAVLASLASAGGGRLDPDPASLWDDETVLRSDVALWPWALLAFLALLPLDLLVRRLNFTLRANKPPVAGGASARAR